MGIRRSSYQRTNFNFVHIAVDECMRIIFYDPSHYFMLLHVWNVPHITDNFRQRIPGLNLIKLLDCPPTSSQLITLNLVAPHNAIERLGYILQKVRKLLAKVTPDSNNLNQADEGAA